MTDTVTPLDRARLDEIRRRRGELRDSMSALESALSAAATGDHGRWAVRVHVALVELSADMRLHVNATEGVRGLHHELRAAQPRLAAAVDQLAQEHVQLRDWLDELLMLLDGPYPVTDAEAIRDGATALLASLAKHRQRGADIVYEAIEFDVGGES